jgi:hypothetical protein
MLDVLSWIVLLLLLLIAIPHPWDARREIAKRERAARSRGLTPP